MAMNLKEIEVLIKGAIPDATVEIQDLAGDGRLNNIKWFTILLKEKWEMNFTH